MKINLKNIILLAALAFITSCGNSSTSRYDDGNNGNDAASTRDTTQGDNTMNNSDMNSNTNSMDTMNIRDTTIRTNDSIR